MTFLVPLIMYGWIPIVFYLFTRFPTQRAVIISFIVAWLFLPQVAYDFPGIPDYTKMSATCYGILFATLVFDFERISSFRLSWVDIPILIWCISPLASSLSNNLGLYDGLASSLSQTVAWGIPYFLGRIYLNNLSALRQLAVGIFIGGLVYIPLCLYEIRMSPQLHRMLYGFHARSFGMTVRYGGFRPTVFMRHGLSVGMWMMTATFIGIVLWRSGAVKKIWGVSIKWLVAALLVTFILLKSTAVYFYLAFGIIIFFIARQLRTSFPLILLMVAISSYLYLGVSGTFSTKFADQTVTMITRITNEDRAGSLEYRFENEAILVEKAHEKIIFGWGGWGRNRVYDEFGNDITTTDSLWIISFGSQGIVGLISVFSILLLPVVALCISVYPGKVWWHPKVAPVAALAIVLTLYASDCLLNNQTNPIYTLTAGGLSGLVVREMGRGRNDIKSSIRLRKTFDLR